MESLKNKFSYLTESDIQVLSELSTFKTFPKKEIIIFPNNLYKKFSFVKKGLLRGYYHNADWEELNVFLVEENMFFTTPEYLTHYKESKYTFEAITDIEIIEFDLKEFEKASFNHENIYRLYIETLKFIIHTFINRLEVLNYSPEKSYIDLTQKRPFLIKNAKKKYLAQFLGITPNSLSRLLNRLNSKN